MNFSKFKTAVHFRFLDYRHTIIAMYLCLYLFLLLFFGLIAFSARYGTSHSTSNGLEFVSAITIFIIGLNSFKEFFKFFTVNGISRITQLYSAMAALGIASAIFSLIDSINTLIFSQFIQYKPLFLIIYGQRYGYSGNLFDSWNSFREPIPLQSLPVNFLWLTFLYFFISMIGLFITTLYYRMNKPLKIIVSIGVPVIFMNVLPAVDSFFFQSRLSTFLSNFCSAAWGVSEGYNPFIGMASMLLFGAFFAALAYLLTRRAVIKK